MVNLGMAIAAADLRMVDAHIVQGERHVTQQEELIAWLKSRGHPTEMAERLLTDFRSALVQHRAHRQTMLLETEQDPLRPCAVAPAPLPVAEPQQKG